MNKVKVFRVIGLVIIVTLGLIFYFQNDSPIVPLIILGSETIALPVAVWLILSAIAGLIISILLQLLFKLVRPKPPSSGSQRDSRQPEPDSGFQFPEVDSKDSIPNQRNSRQTEASPREQKQDWEFPIQREDWEEPDDWNIEEPPPPRETPPRSETIYEVPQTPEQTSQQGSMYSYRYREVEDEVLEDNDNQQDDPSRSNPQNIYDANYRVIRPPLWNLPDDEEDDDIEDEPKR